MAGRKWQISDELWEKIASLIPEHKTSHPISTHRKRVDNRAAMDAIFFVLRTGLQWNALNATGICSSSSAHLRFRNGAMEASSSASGSTGRPGQKIRLYPDKVYGAGWWKKISTEPPLRAAQKSQMPVKTRNSEPIAGLSGGLIAG